MKHPDKITAADRIAALRTRCRQRKAQRWMDTTIVDYRSFLDSERLSSHTLRMGRRTRDRLAQFRFAMDDMELLVGRPAPPAGVGEAEHKEAKEYLSRVPYAWTPGQTGHCELDRRLVFDHGVDGVLQILTERKNAEQDPTRRDTFESFVLAMEGFQTLVLNAERAVRDAIPAAGEPRREELEEMARVCARCAHLPPQTFREALQLTWFVDLAVSFADNGGMINPGHLDRTLAEWYRRDVDGGVLSRGEALTLVECFYILINDYVPDGLAIAVMVGGVDANGDDLTNDLSYVCMEALRRTNLAYPTVGVCWHDKTPSDLVDLTVGLIADGFTTPAFFNDGTIQAGLRKYGVPPSESWNYINSTCVEITPAGASNVWVASPYYSVCAILNEEIKAIASNGRAPATFDDFLRSYLARLGAAIAEGVRRENESRAKRQQYGRKPLQSVFTRDCVESGRDIDDGGAKYNWVECSFVGLANLTDSLQVIRKEIFETKSMSFGDLHRILASNFADEERVHSRFLFAHEKYGQDNETVDALFGRLVAFVVAECATHRMAPGDTHFVPGAFCWIMHERLGKACGATPDGRRAGTPFADGCGPAQGRETRGPTAAILSTTSWDASPLIGGAAFNMKFSRALFRDGGGRARLRDLIVTFLKRGGFEIQINVVDNDLLRYAKAHPDEHRDLVVRIGGYTDYFVRLSPEMQDEVILRTEYATV